MTNQSPKKRPSRRIRGPEGLRKFADSLSPQLRKELEAFAPHSEVHGTTMEILQTEIQLFAKAAASLIHCLEEAIRALTDRRNYNAVPDDDYESEKHELLNVIEDSLIKRIKMSDIESVPPEKQTLVIELMLDVLRLVAADERKRLS
jgi:hypothetical protein